MGPTSMRQKGMTLIEIMIAMTILSIIVVIVMDFMSTMAESLALEQQVSELDEDMHDTIDQMAEMLRCAYIPNKESEDWLSGLYTGGNDVPFIVPVDHDGDGDLFDDNMQPEYGAIRKNFSPPRHYKDMSHLSDAEDPNDDYGYENPFDRFIQIFTFVRTGYLKETERNIDLNSDGDMVDTFEIGRIELQYPSGQCYVPNSTHENDILDSISLPLTGYIVVLGDTDGNGNDIDEPIFKVTGKTLMITLYGTKDTESRLLLRRMSSTIHLRNL